MAKTSDEILLEEAKAGYTRQLANWYELNRKYNRFIQLNGLLLTIIFIGNYFRIEHIKSIESFDLINSYASSFFFYSAFLFIASSILITLFAIRPIPIKEIKVNLDDNSDLVNKERDIILSLIKESDIAQKNIISKHNARSLHLLYSTLVYLGGLVFLFLSFAIIYFSTID